MISRCLWLKVVPLVSALFGEPSLEEVLTKISGTLRDSIGAAGMVSRQGINASHRFGCWMVPGSASSTRAHGNCQSAVLAEGSAER